MLGSALLPKSELCGRARRRARGPCSGLCSRVCSRVCSRLCSRVCSRRCFRLCSRPKHRPSWASLGRRAHLAEPREGADHAAQLRTVRVARLVAELVVRAVLGRPPDGPALGGEAAEQGEQHAHLVTGQGRGEGGAGAGVRVGVGVGVGVGVRIGLCGSRRTG